jgi:hypothetical protein
MKEVSDSATERDQVYPQLDLLPGQYAHVFKEKYDRPRYPHSQ